MMIRRIKRGAKRIGIRRSGGKIKRRLV